MSNDSFYSVLTKLEGKNCNLFGFLSPFEHNYSEHVLIDFKSNLTDCLTEYVHHVGAADSGSDRICISTHVILLF